MLVTASYFCKLHSYTTSSKTLHGDISLYFGRSSVRCHLDVLLVNDQRVYVELKSIKYVEFDSNLFHETPYGLISYIL